MDLVRKAHENPWPVTWRLPQPGYIPLLRLISATFGDAMKASNARTASGWLEVTDRPPEKVVMIWIAGASFR